MSGRKSARVAYSALLGAISLIFLYGAAIFPTGVWGLVAIAGLGPCAAVASLGISVGFLCWGGVSLLALLLLPDKFCALLFLFLFGLYPMLKARAEQARSRRFAWIVKLVFFNLSFTLLVFFLKSLMLASLPEFLNRYGIPVLYLVANIVFFIYDFGLTKLIIFYLDRIDNAIRKWIRR